MLNNAIEITDEDIQIVLTDHGITVTPVIIQRARNLIEPNESFIKKQALDACLDSDDDEENLGRQTDALHRAIYESIVSFNGFGRGINDVRNVGNVLRIYTIDYKAMDSESAPLDLSFECHAENYAHAIEQLVDAQRHAEPIIHIPDVHAETGERAPCLVLTGDNPSEGNAFAMTGDRVQITVGNMKVYLNATHEGLIVDVYPRDGDNESVASLCLGYSDIPSSSSDFVVS